MPSSYCRNATAATRYAFHFNLLKRAFRHSKLKSVNATKKPRLGPSTFGSSCLGGHPFLKWVTHETRKSDRFLARTNVYLRICRFSMLKCHKQPTARMRGKNSIRVVNLTPATQQNDYERRHNASSCCLYHESTGIPTRYFG
jgi:hypothetical protein